MAIYSEFSHQKWWFSIVMLNYQRVSQTSSDTVGEEMWREKSTRIQLKIHFHTSSRCKPNFASWIFERYNGIPTKSYQKSLNIYKTRIFIYIYMLCFMGNTCPKINLTHLSHGFGMLAVSGIKAFTWPEIPECPDPPGFAPFMVPDRRPGYSLHIKSYQDPWGNSMTILRKIHENPGSLKISTPEKTPVFTSFGHLLPMFLDVSCAWNSIKRVLHSVWQSLVSAFRVWGLPSDHRPPPALGYRAIGFMEAAWSCDPSFRVMHMVRFCDKGSWLELGTIMNHQCHSWTWSDHLKGSDSWAHRWWFLCSVVWPIPSYSELNGSDVVGWRSLKTLVKKHIGRVVLVGLSNNLLFWCIKFDPSATRLNVQWIAMDCPCRCPCWSQVTNLEHLTPWHSTRQRQHRPQKRDALRADTLRQVTQLAEATAGGSWLSLGDSPETINAGCNVKCQQL